MGGDKKNVDAFVASSGMRGDIIMECLLPLAEPMHINSKNTGQNKIMLVSEEEY